MNDKQNNQNPNPKKRFSVNLSRLFMSNRFVLVFSLFASIVLWFIMAINNTESRARVVDSVPISVALKDNVTEEGYRIFWMSDDTARVSVTGNSLTVNQLGENDIRIEPVDTSTMTRTGYYTLNLTARKNSDKTDYNVDTVYPGSVNIFVDKYAEKTFEIEQNIQYTIADGFYATKPVLSAKKLTITGPESEVSNVGRVALEKVLDTPLESSRKFNQACVFYDKDGNLMSTLGHMTASEDAVEVSITVLKQAELPLQPTFKNIPAGLDLSNIVTVEPQTLAIGYEKKEEEPFNQENIQLEEIDLAEVTLAKNTVQAGFELPKGCTNINGTKKALVTFNLLGYGEKTFTASKFQMRNEPKGKRAETLTKELSVTMIGPTGQLAQMKDSDLIIVTDLQNLGDETGSLAVPATVQINSRFGSWAVGTYEVYLNITDR